MNRYNAEGYPDPTTYDALSRVVADYKKAHALPGFLAFEGYRPLVYICSPYAGDIRQNTHNARKYSRFALKRNAIPLTPHLLYPQFMKEDDPAERRLALRKINYVLIGKCDELWVFGGVLSSGMEYEISVAKKRKMRIRYFTEEMRERDEE